MVIVMSLNNSQDTAKKIAKAIKAKYTQTEVSAFPDNDIYMRFNTKVKGEKVIIVESFANPDSNWALYSSIFAAQTAKRLGAKKVILVAPYLAFMRQDKEFKSGEAINAQIMGSLINSNFDKILTIDPHLHRIRKMKDLFTIEAKNLTANHEIAKFIKSKFIKSNVKHHPSVSGPLIMGPDWESYQWADKISAELGVKDTVLHKDRHSSRDVDVKMTDNTNLKGMNVVIVDDIISTGNTMIKAAIKAKKLGAKSITAIGVHGLFVENGYKKMEKYFNNIYTLNTINHKSNKIDCSPILIEELKRKI